MSVQLLRLAQGHSEWSQSQSVTSSATNEKRRMRRSSNEARQSTHGFNFEEDGGCQGQRKSMSNKDKADMDPLTALLDTGSISGQREASKAQLRDELQRASLECDRPEIGQLKHSRASFQDQTPQTPVPKRVSRSSVEYPRPPKRVSDENRSPYDIKMEALKLKTELQNDMLQWYGCEEDACDPSDVSVRDTFAESSPQSSPQSPAIKAKTRQASVRGSSDGRTRASIDRRSAYSSGGTSSSSEKPGEESSGSVVEVVAKPVRDDYTYGKPKSSREKQQEKSISHRFLSCLGIK